MTHVVVVTEAAVREIEDAAAWWAREHSVDQAERWYSGIRQAITTLAEHPRRCATATESDDFGYELRELHYGLGARPTHRVVFTIVKETVVVLAVWQVAQERLRPGDV